MNYDGVFNLKNDLREGLVIFYNQERFDKLNSDYSVISQGTELDEFKDVWSQIENENVKQAFLNRNTIIQVPVCRNLYYSVVKYNFLITTYLYHRL